MSYFLSKKWLGKKLHELGKDRSPYHVAALLHIYLGSLSLEEISEKSGLNLDTLRGLRTVPRFMRLVDTFKKQCSQEFREDLLINERRLEEYDTVASDFTILDEILRMQIKVPLFTQLSNLSNSIQSRKTHSLKIDTPELLLFRRLFCFFIFIEKYSHTLTSKALSNMKHIAEEIVWPALHMDIKEINHMLSEPLDMNKRLKELREGLNELLL